MWKAEACLRAREMHSPPRGLLWDRRARGPAPARPIQQQDGGRGLAPEHPPPTLGCAYRERHGTRAPADRGGSAPSPAPSAHPSRKTPEPAPGSSRLTSREAPATLQVGVTPLTGPSVPGTAPSYSATCLPRCGPRRPREGGQSLGCLCLRWRKRPRSPQDPWCHLTAQRLSLPDQTPEACCGGYGGEEQGRR